MDHDSTRSSRARTRDRAKVRIKGAWTAVPNKLLKDKRLSRDARLLGSLMVLHAGNSDKAFPGQEELADELSHFAEVEETDPGTGETRTITVERKITVRSVQRWLTELREAGWLNWRQTLKNNEYTLLDPTESDGDAAPSENEGMSDSSLNGALTGATAVSSGATAGSHGDATAGSPGATAVSSSGAITGSAPATEESCQATAGSPPLIPVSRSTMLESDSSNTDSLDIDSAAAETVPAHHPAAAAAATRRCDRSRNAAGPPAGARPPVVAYLADLGVNAAEEFMDLPLDAVQARVEQIKRNPDWRPSDIVVSLRRNPPRPVAQDRYGVPITNPIDVERYTNGAYGDLFRRGSDTSDLELTDDEERERTAGG